MMSEAVHKQSATVKPGRTAPSMAWTLYSSACLYLHRLDFAI